MLDLGTKVGLKESAIQDMLNSDKYLDEIKADIEYSENTLQLQFIPFYRINNKVLIQGAISDDEYIQALKMAYEGWKNGDQIDNTEFKGQSCSIDGVCS